MIIEQIQKYDYNQLILVDLLYKNVNELTGCDRKTFNVYIARLAKKGLIERLHRGVYYRAKETKFGKTKPNLYKETVLLHTYGFKGFFGHETLLNLLGLKNEIPKKLTIYTNEIMQNKFVDDRVKLKKINVNLNHENIDYIEIITFLKDLNKTELNNVRLFPTLAKYMIDKGLQFDKLFDYMVDVDEKVLRNLIPLKKALNYETAQYG